MAHHVVEFWRYPSLGFAASAESYQEFCAVAAEIGAQQLLEFVKNSRPRGTFSRNSLWTWDRLRTLFCRLRKPMKTDLIVMGTHGRRGYDRLMLGSVTDRVMRRAPCPVLAVSKLRTTQQPTGEERRAITA